MNQGDTFDSIVTIDSPTLVQKPIERQGKAHSMIAGEVVGARRAALVIALARVARRDTAALNEVYRMTYAKLKAVCLTVCFDYQDAEEALQDCYLAVWRNAAQFDASRASPITWLARIARNKAIDRMRTRALIRKHAGEFGLVEGTRENDYPDTAPDPEELLAVNQRRDFASSIIENLQCEHAALVRAIYLEGLTFSQLAGRSGLPLANVKTRVRRAILTLRAQLENRN
jgi:RNA polymerase sigma-70 factor, ECF subfamily